MQQSATRSRRLVMRLLAILAVAAALVPANPAGAQYYPVFDGAPYDQLAGVQEATQRLYQNTTSAQLNIYATITRFDTDDNAAAGLETLNAYYLDAFAAAASPLAFEPVDAPPPGARAYHATLALPGQDPYGEAAFVQGQQGPLVVEVLVLNYDSDPMPVDDANTIAEKMYGAITAPVAEAATPAAGAISDRLPAMGDELVDRYGVSYTEDAALLEPAPSTPPPADTPYGDPAHLVTVVDRTYAAVDPQTGEPTDGLRGYVQIAVFDDPDSAHAGYEGMNAEVAAELEGQAPEVITAAVKADATTAYAGQAEDETGTVRIAAIVAQSDVYVITVLAGSTDDTDPVAVAEDLMQSVIDAEAGDGEAVEGSDGIFTGGVWDKLPAAGDGALAGMVPVEDNLIYP